MQELFSASLRFRGEMGYVFGLFWKRVTRHNCGGFERASKKHALSSIKIGRRASPKGVSKTLLDRVYPAFSPTH
jgi:hypothetical protein